MKRLLFILICSCLAASSQAQQILELHDGSLSDGIKSTVPTRDVQTLDDGYLVTYTFDNALILSDNLYTGTVFWKIDGFGLNESAGEPSTLLRNDLLNIPSGCSARIEVVDSAYQDFSYELTPAHPALLNSNDEGYSKQNVPAITPYSGFFPSSVASLGATLSYRGQKLCQASVAPIQYDYNNKKVRAYTPITYKVTFEPQANRIAATEAKSEYISPDDNLLGNITIGGTKNNVQRAGAFTVGTLDVKDYLILTCDKYLPAVERFAQWKRMLGFNVHVISRGDWTYETIKASVTEQYESLPALYYLLIVGDHEDGPEMQSELKIPHVTDLYYGCMDDDLLPEIYRGRLSVSSLEEANTVIDKIIGYEMSPPTNSSFYENGVNCAYFEDKLDTLNTRNPDGYADRRFAQTAEDVRNYVMLQGKNVQRVYYAESSVTPQYWNKGKYSNGEMIPDELKRPGFLWNGHYTDITNIINNGVFYVLHRDHGAVYGWGSPAYYQRHISSLSNGNLLPVVFSMNCQTGMFDDDCFAETFLRKKDGGCVAIYAATQSSISGYNDALTTGMFDAIWPEPGLSIQIPSESSSLSSTPTPTYTLGQILEQGMIRMMETYVNPESLRNVKYTNELFHCFGDPSMHIYTKCPTSFGYVSISRTSSNMTVKVNDEGPARITFYDPETGDVQSYIDKKNITILTGCSDRMVVCVSAHNKIPYIQVPDVKYIQNTELTGTVDEKHDVIRVGNNVTSSIPVGDVTTSNADITLRAKKTVLDKGTYISVGTKLRIESTVNNSGILHTLKSDE